MKKIIIDTDLGGDCDDAGALAVACNLAKRGDAELLAVTYCIGNPWGAYFVRYELDYFGFSHVPVGSLKEPDFMSAPNYAKYTKPCCERFGAKKVSTEDAVRVLRRALAENSDVTLIAIGPLRNIAGLLDSPADDISPLPGRELIRRSVSEFVTMLGSFDRPDYVEWNVLMDIPSAQRAVAGMPVPIIFAPHELGNHIFTGHPNERLPEGHPVREAYLTFSDGKSFLRQSWDLITVYCAVTDSSLWKRRETSVSIDDKGRCVESRGAGMFVLEQLAPDDEIVETIDQLIK